MSISYDPFDARSIGSIQNVVIRAENGEDWPTRVADLCKSCRALIMHINLTEAYLRAAENRAAFFEAHALRAVEGDGSDLPVGTVVIDRGGHPLIKADDEWNVARFDDYTPSLTEDNRAPYSIVWTPEENTNE